MIEQLKKRYNASLFEPSWFGLLFNPYYIIRKGLYVHVKKHSAALSGHLMDFGSGSKPYRKLFHVEHYIGVDIETSGHDHSKEEIDVYYDGKTIPFADHTFDSVFSSEVFEHIFNLDEILTEIHRVMKPGARMLITIPFVWDEHEIPYDFARYTSFGAEHILKGKGFRILEREKTTPYVSTLFQMWNAYVYQHLFPKHKTARILLTPLFITPITLLGLFLSALLPKNYNFYHNNIFLVEKPKLSLMEEVIDEGAQKLPNLHPYLKSSESLHER
jgi:SAM-dependent methyltransferase